MPRQAKLRKKKVRSTEYWFTESGGPPPTYFGKVTEVPYKEARTLFAEHVRSLSEGIKARNGLTCAELFDQFLEWIHQHRSLRTYDQRRRDCNRFGNFRLNGQRIADLPAARIKGADLEQWLDHLQKTDELDAQTRLHAETSIKHCWNWASKHPSPTPYLPSTFRPFSSVERTHVPRKVLTEDDLITDAEIEAVLKAARVDLDIFHRFGPKSARVQNPYEDFSDMLRCYYHTGARTGELARVEVGDVLPKTKQVVLGKHKTSRTQRVQGLRVITLNEEAIRIFELYSSGKAKRDRVFTSSDGKPWKSRTLPSRFARVKEVATTMGFGQIRGHITIYDFRHLWISEALMAGNDVATVARMAGTSIAMIERTYGHFRNEHLHEAQARLDEARKKRRG